MKRHFADAFFFFAWWNRRDRAHGRVEAFLREFDGHLLTTRWVLMEVADGLASTPARREVRALFAELESDPLVSIIEPDDSLNRRGARPLRRAPRQGMVADGLHFIRGDGG